MSRIAVAGFVHETNTFSPIPTDYEDFALPKGSNPGLLRGEELLEFFRGKKLNLPACGFIAAAEQAGHQIIPLCYCSAEPSGQVSANAFERIMRIIEGGLEGSLPLDGVFLNLHGAMVYEAFNDGESEILRRVRAIVKDIPIVASLDLHGNIARSSIDYASALIGFRTYPHIDEYETGERCAVALDYLLSGKRLHKAFRQIPFLIAISTQSTRTEPAKSIYALIQKVEAQPRAISATVMMGFPPADIRDAGASVFAYGVTQTAASAAVDQLCDAILACEPEFVPNLWTADRAVEEAIAFAKTATKPVILADVQDNAGAGGTSDTPWLLKSLVRRNAQGAALGIMYDPEAAALAHVAGEGVDVELHLGGKLTPGQTPFHGVFHVEKLSDGVFEATGPMMGGQPMNLGKMAQLRINGTRIVVSSARVQANDQSFFRQVGIEPRFMKILALKSTNHFRADFEPIASRVISIAAPGAIVEDPAHVLYQNLREGVRLGALGPANRRGS